MNEVFDKLVKSKIEKFVFDYKRLSREVFVNENGELKHPAEFGIYREKIIKHLIHPFLPSRLAIGTGFIITSKNETSTQCDLIIYDKDNTPVIENEEQRFFPIECVVGVIEVKSRLDKSKLKEALIKLSKVKKLRDNYYCQEHIEIAIDYVESYGYINDFTYAIDFITYRATQLSRRQREQKLLQKGVDEKVLAEAFATFYEKGNVVEEEKQIQRFINKKNYFYLEDEKQRQKVIASLLRKGFSLDNIKRCINNANSDRD